MRMPSRCTARPSRSTSTSLVRSTRAMGASEISIGPAQSGMGAAAAAGAPRTEATPSKTKRLSITPPTQPPQFAMKLPDPATTLSNVSVLLVNEGLSVVAGTLILIIGWIAATWAKRLTARGLAHLPIDLTLKPLIASLVRYAILALTFVLMLGQFGVQTTSLIALLGAAGLA